MGGGPLAKTRVGWGSNVRGMGTDSDRPDDLKRGQTMEQAQTSYEFNIDNGLAIVGSPDTVIEKLQEGQKKIGYDLFCTSFIGRLPKRTTTRPWSFGARKSSRPSSSARTHNPESSAAKAMQAFAVCHALAAQEREELESRQRAVREVCQHHVKTRRALRHPVLRALGPNVRLERGVSDAPDHLRHVVQ